MAHKPRGVNAMTRTQITELIDAAARLVAKPPDEPHNYSYLAQVSWDDIKRVRKAIEDAGFDWRIARGTNTGRNRKGAGQ